MPTLLLEDLIWCLRRLPKPMRDLMKARPNELFVAGGYVRACIAREEVQDVDFFSPSKDIAAACAMALSDGGRFRVIETDNAFTVLTRPFTAQFIHRWTFQTPEAAVDSFDFTIAKAAFWHNRVTWQSTADERFYPDLCAKRLVYTSPTRNEDAGGSMLRVLKFYQRGYRIPLDSLGAVMARMAKALDYKRPVADVEEFHVAKVFTGMLREVDPAFDPEHLAHLPSTPGPELIAPEDDILY